MKATTRFEATHAFIMDNNDVQKVWAIVGETCRIDEAKIYCSDGISRYFEGPEEIIAYENPKRAKILSMALSGTSDNNDTSIDLVISDQHIKTLSFNLRGEEKVILKLRTELMDYFQGLKPWYSRLATFDSFFFWMPLFIIIAFIMLVKFPQGSTGQPDISIKQSITIGLAAFVILGCSIATSIAAIIGSKKLAKAFFPVATFSIGQGKKRHDLAEQFRWGVIVAMAVSFIVSLGFFIAT